MGTLAECKYTITEDAHSDWVSQVRFSPSAKQPLIVSCGWDKLVKVWNLNNCKLRDNLPGWFALRLRREGRHGDALGRERRQAPLLARCVGADPGALLQPEELLAVRRDGHVDQDLGLGEQERPGRDLPGGEEQDGPPVVGFDDLERGREHALRGKHGWRHLRVRHRGLSARA